jgi:phosphoglycolate phosphatase-like HAD superfamily hydrolase
MNNIKKIIWDFDGVILLSDEVREYGFRKIFEDYPAGQVEQLIDFHTTNGGLSRYVKIRFFYEDVLKKEISEAEVNVLAENFSVIMKEALTNKKLLNPQWLQFMEKKGAKYEHSIASGSDGTELNYLCEQLGVNHHFKAITGSPVTKKELVARIVKNSGLRNDEIVLIGDAINDYEAAEANKIGFIGYHNPVLADKGIFVDDLTKLAEILN